METNWYSVGGRQRIRLRDTYVRDVVGPLLATSATGVAKLDIVLRGLAMQSDAAEGRVPADISWEMLHDWCRDRDTYRADRRLKQKWINDKLIRLESLGLLSRRSLPGRQSEIIMLSDRYDLAPFDDPGARGDSYVTVLGDLMRFDLFGAWGAPELSAHLAAMNAERYARIDPLLSQNEKLEDRPFGGGRWFRPLSWFADTEQHRPAEHIRYRFSDRTLRRGLKSLSKQGLVAQEWISRDPRTAKEFDKGPRVLYHNGFDDMRGDAESRRARLWQRVDNADRNRALPLSQSGLWIGQVQGAAH